MQEPNRIPMNPEISTQKPIKKYPLPPLSTPHIENDPLSLKEHIIKIHDDFFVKDTLENIKKNYEDIE